MARQVESHLYFILNPALGIIKIGIAEDVPSRVRTLECGCGVALEVLRVMEGRGDIEKMLHGAFTPSRLLGEWFEPTDELLSIIAGTLDPDAYIKQMQPQMAQWALDAQERRRAQQERLAAEEAAYREERRRLTEAKKRLEAERAERSRKRHEAKARREREAALARQRAWENRDPSIVSRTVKAELVVVASERKRRLLNFQRGRNAAVLGMAPIATECNSPDRKAGAAGVGS